MCAIKRSKKVYIWKKVKKEESEFRLSKTREYYKTVRFLDKLIIRRELQSHLQTQEKITDKKHLNVSREEGQRKVLSLTFCFIDNTFCFQQILTRSVRTRVVIPWLGPGPTPQSCHSQTHWQVHCRRVVLLPTLDWGTVWRGPRQLQQRTKYLAYVGRLMPLGEVY